MSGSGPSSTPPPPARRFAEWAESIDPLLRRAWLWPVGWSVAALGYGALLAVVATAPPLRGFFDLEPLPVIGLLAAALAFALAVYRQERLGRLTSMQRALCTLGIAFLFQLALSATVSFSAAPGAYVFAALPLLAIWLHVPVIGGSVRHPFPLAAHALAMLAALALRPDATHLAVFGAVIPLGIAGGLVGGTLLSELSGQRAALSRHRSAIWAQVLATRAEEVDRLSETLRRTRALREEGEEARQVALCAAQAIGEGVRDGASAGELRASLAALDEALRRLARSAAAIRELARHSPPSSAGALPVQVYTRACETLAALTGRHPHVSFSCLSASPRAESARAAVGGGDEGLRRILEVAVANACEGDGERGAFRVEVLVSDEPELRLVTLEVRDDGPGFAAALLTRPIEAFATTKPGASGLGLYTAERLARAGGGFLRRDNGAGGGARVTVFLPAVAA